MLIEILNKDVVRINEPVVGGTRVTELNDGKANTRFLSHDEFNLDWFIIRLGGMTKKPNILERVGNVLVYNQT